MISYAQNFEDVMLERLFAGQARGFYVDVGAWDPHRLSTTKHFYLRGWRGINIEPIEARCQLFRVARPQDVNLNLAIAEQPGDIAFWVCGEDDARSTAEASVADTLIAQGLSLFETRVRTRRLDEILAEHGSTEIDFLKIDVEGREADVMRTISFERWRPRVLLIEATIPGAKPEWSKPEAIGTWQAWEPGLFESGYVFAHFDGLNRFYVRAEEEHLAARFQLPPGAFDNIEESGLNAGRSADLLEVIQKLEAESAARLEVIQKLDAENAARLEVIQKLEAARLEVIQNLGARVARPE